MRLVYKDFIKRGLFVSGLITFTMVAPENVRILQDNFTLQVGFLGAFLMFLSFVLFDKMKKEVKEKWKTTQQ